MPALRESFRPSENLSADPSGGANQVRVRAWNERLVLSLVRRHGELAKADIARRSGLSPQTVSVIMRGLEEEKLLLRGEPQRGRVGQPSVPMKLNPQGALAFGVKIGRRSADLVLVDFLGGELASRHMVYRFPEPEPILSFVAESVAEVVATLPDDLAKRIAGIGVATPFQLWNWASEIGAPHDRMAAWRHFDIGREVGAVTGLPTHVQNDATSACGAELAFGLGAELADFVYFYVGTFIGGGIVLNHALYAGRTGNAGALGSLPVARSGEKMQQLIKGASIFELERAIEADNGPIAPLWRSGEDWRAHAAYLDAWLEKTAQNIAVAVVAACSIIDFEAAVIDGAFPEEIRIRLVARVGEVLNELDLQGIERPRVLAGTIGQNARAIGGASQPLFDRFLLDQNVLFKATR